MDKWDTETLAQDELALIAAAQGDEDIVTEEKSAIEDLIGIGNVGEKYDLDGELTTSFQGTLAECVEHTLLKSLSHCADFSRSTPLVLVGGLPGFPCCGVGSAK